MFLVKDRRLGMHPDGEANHSRLSSMTYPNGEVLNNNYASGLDVDMKTKANTNPQAPRRTDEDDPNKTRPVFK